VSLNDGSEVGDIIGQGTDSLGSDGRDLGASRWLGFLGPGWERPRWRPSRGAAVLAAVTLLAGVGAGFAAGSGTSGGAAPAPVTVSTVSTATTPNLAVNPLTLRGPAVEQFPESCSAQAGSELQLGVEVLNDSPAAVTLTGVNASFPGSGGVLSEVSWQWAPCGAITYGLYQSTVHLAPGAGAWLSVTLKVNVPCPAAYPVPFTVTYSQDGATLTARLPGFAGLGDVPYSGCPSPSLSSSAAVLRPVYIPAVIPADRPASLHHQDAADVLAVKHVLVALVDVLERIGAGDHAVQVEQAVAVEAE
jgi:hypothetical protein